MDVVGTVEAVGGLSKAIYEYGILIVIVAIFLIVTILLFVLFYKRFDVLFQHMIDRDEKNNNNLNDIGRVFRVKGFMKNQSGDWMELNATTQKMTVNPIKEGQEILIVIGEDLKEDKIRECLEDKCTEGAENE